MHLDFPDLFLRMKESMDVALLHVYEGFIGRGLAPELFLEKHEDSFAMFVGKDNARHMVDSALRKVDADAGIFSEAVAECVVFRVAFQAQAKTNMLKNFSRR